MTKKSNNPVNKNSNPKNKNGVNYFECLVRQYPGLQKFTKSELLEKLAENRRISE